MAQDRKTLGQQQGDQRKGKEGAAKDQPGIGQPAENNPSPVGNQGVSQTPPDQLGGHTARDPGGNRS
ncbi:MAG TPA: hypothetical protein VED40_16010 [Azospirillaceae bacterium]|nr:hypothetical protein [Azospirillaceae bacterium]